MRSNLTLNYGLRWDRIEPWYEKNNGISTFEPGKQSVVFPGAPAGILFPTDPGVPRTLAPPGNLGLAPRVGLAYSPDAIGRHASRQDAGWPGTTSVRAGFGMYYTAIEALRLGIWRETRRLASLTPVPLRRYLPHLSLRRRPASFSASRFPSR